MDQHADRIARAAAEAVAAMIEADSSMVDTILADPESALASLGISGVLGIRLAARLAEESGSDVAGYWGALKEPQPGPKSLVTCRNCTNINCISTVPKNQLP